MGKHGGGSATTTRRGGGRGHGFLTAWAAQDATELAGLSLANAWMTSDYLQDISTKIEAARPCVFASRALDAAKGGLAKLQDAGRALARNAEAEELPGELDKF